MNQQCGYRGLGHYCQNGQVQFISRYRGTNDYCVDGRRVAVTDEGQVHRAQADDVERIYSFEAARYTEYLQWHADNPIMQGTPLPFDAGIARAERQAA